MTNFVSIGDLSQSLFMKQQLASLKSQTNRLTQELTSGRVTNLPKLLGGDMSALAGVDHSLSQLASYKRSIGEAGQFTEAVQHVLGAVQNFAGSVAPTLLAASDSGYSNHLDPALQDARTKFDDTVAALNQKFAGRALLSGTATDRTPLMSATDMLSQLQTAIAAETTAAGVLSVVDSWFDDPGGGFETNAYQGATTDLAPFSIAEGSTVPLELRADDPRIRTVLKGFAIASLVSEGALSTSSDDQRALIQRAGEVLLEAEGQVVKLRAETGVVEERIERAATENAVQTTALTLIRAEMVEADPYKTATELESTKAQIETLYAITARLSRMKLTDYLR